MSNKQTPSQKCNCKPSWDVRVTCWVEHKTFDTCPEKLRTIYFRIKNDYNLYDNTINNIEYYVRTECRLNQREWDELEHKLLVEDFEVEDLHSD